MITALILLFLSSAGAAQEPAPDFNAIDIQSGEQVRLADYRGKVVFLDFWASWCPPCLVSLPAYQRMYEQYRSSDWALVAINVDEDTEDGLEFLVDNPVTYPVIADPRGDIGIPYNIRSLPVSYLIDQQGNIVERYRGFEPGDEEQILQEIRALISNHSDLKE
ncbi:MAG: TlpA disulfide reductase family protein [Pseudohongiellaceae bacterium]|jgi:thiol-disulfide isomerase/thioredoxin